MSTLLLPSMRGLMGDWAYYTCLMKLKDVAARVKFAERIYGNTNLNKLVQRELKGKRAKQICDYLTGQPQRFFGSLIVASQGGAPEWFQLSRIDAGRKEPFLQVPADVMYSLGILKLAGTEDLFALDGQHRLAGIQQAIGVKPELGEEEVSVIFVAHTESVDGLARSRRLFTTLNKKAVPVRIGEVIALDEDDVMAITTRRLVREHPLFINSKVSGSVTSNIPRGDGKCFTTLATLYIVLKIVFTKIKKSHDSKILLGEKVDISFGATEYEAYYRYAVKIFDELCKRYPELKKYREAKEEDLEAVMATLRHKDGGHILFRPVGLKVVVDAIASAAVSVGLNRAMDLVSSCPTEFSKPPFAQVIWRAADGKVLHKGVSLGSRLIQHMIGIKCTTAQLAKLIEDYEKATGLPQTLASLPKLK